MTESIPKTLRTRAEIDQEFQTLCMVNGDKALKIQFMKAEIEKNQLRLAQLTQETSAASTPEDPVISKVASQITQLGRTRKTKNTKATNSTHQ